MSEIGSHFHLAPVKNSPYNNFPVFTYLNTGRACLYYLNKVLYDGPILLPSYLCDSIVNSFTDRPIVYYNINPDLSINLPDMITKIKKGVSGVLMINYFGVIDENIDIIVAYCNSNRVTIIEDITHSYLTTDKYYGDFVFGSIRKTLPILDGAVIKVNCNYKSRYTILWSRFSREVAKENNSYGYSYIKFMTTRYLGMWLKNFTSFKSWWRPLLLSSDDMLEDNNYVNYISNISKDIIIHSNLSEVKNIREHNYIELNKALNKWSMYPNKILHFGYILKFDNGKIRNEVKQCLIENKMYPMIHWPVPKVINNKISNDIYSTILTLPIDQRYTINDMKRMCDIVLKHLHH